MSIQAVQIFDKISSPSAKDKNLSVNTNNQSFTSAKTDCFWKTAGTVVGIGAIAALALYAKHNIDDKYIGKLARDLSVDLGKKIKTSQLKSVISPKEFLKIIPSLKEQNYIPSPENIKAGIFRADLHSHSIFSDGRLSVQEILSQAAKYGDFVKQKTGKTFIFAISDHDGVEGVKEALRIITQNPEKYKNISFVPAAELSFPIKCSKDSGKAARNPNPNPTEFSELLAYCINPFSQNSAEFFSGLYSKRTLAINKAISAVSEKVKDVKFSLSEYDKYFEVLKTKRCMLNQHWRIYNYLNMKNLLARTAQKTNENPEQFFIKIMDELPFDRRNPYQLKQLLLSKGYTVDMPETDEIISKTVKSEIFPVLKGSSAFSNYDNNFSDVINYADREKAILAFAHPGFTIQNFSPETARQDLMNLINLSNGRILFAEKYHQVYPIGRTIELDELVRYNAILDKANLLYLGGRDNHSLNFTNFDI